MFEHPARIFLCVAFAVVAISSAQASRIDSLTYANSGNGVVLHRAAHPPAMQVAGLWGKIKRGAKKVGRAAKKVGRGAKKVGRAAKKVGRGAKKGAKWVGRKVKKHRKLIVCDIAIRAASKAVAAKTGGATKLILRGATRKAIRACKKRI